MHDIFFSWNLSGSSLYPWYSGILQAYLGVGLFIIYFAGYSVGFSFLQFWDMFLYFGFDHFLPAVSSSISGTPVLDVGVPQLILQFSHLFCCLFLHLVILLPRIVCLLLFSNSSH